MIEKLSVSGAEGDARSSADEVKAEVIHTGSSESRGDATAAGVLATGEGWLGWSAAEWLPLLSELLECWMGVEEVLACVVERSTP